MAVDVKAISEKIAKESAFIDKLFEEISKVIVGQKYMIERMLIGMIADGHILLEGVPGLAKTTAVSTLSKAINTVFRRVQFTPDLLPADIIGTLIYNQKTSEFTTRKGPIFANIVLADEINRAPAKVQSALLEAMQERQVTIGDASYKLPAPFLVMATQNPIEQEGTYPLPEAQIDRFMFKLKVVYPTKKEELDILNRMCAGNDIKISPVVEPADISRARTVMHEIYMDDKIKDYIVNIVTATRNPEAAGIAELKDLVAYGASPRATIFLTLAAKAHAFLKRRGYVTPEDVKAIGMDVLRHRVILTYEAEAEEITSEQVVQKIFDHVEVP